MSEYILEDIRQGIEQRLHNCYDFGDISTLITAEDKGQYVLFSLYVGISFYRPFVYFSVRKGNTFVNSIRFQIDVCWKIMADKIVSNVVYNLTYMLNVNNKHLPHHGDDLVLDKKTWRETLPTCPLIKVFFDVTIEAHPTTVYRLVTFTEKYSGTGYEGYFKETKTGYTRCSSNRYEFAEIRGETNLKLSWEDFYDSDCDPYFDRPTNTLLIPKMGFIKDQLTCWTIEKETAENIIINIVRVTGIKDRQISFSNESYSLRYNKKREPIYSRQEVPLPIWTQQIADITDVIKNPLNKAIHEHLPPNDIPIYEGNNIWITSQDKVYIRICDENWMPVYDGLEWLTLHPQAVPKDVRDELNRYLLSKKLQE